MDTSAAKSFISKRLAQYAINGPAGTKVVGLGALLRSQELGGWVNPDSIDSYIYNYDDGNWYDTPPAPDYGQWDWSGRADPSKKSELDAKRRDRIQGNEVENRKPWRDIEPDSIPGMMKTIEAWTTIIWKKIVDAASNASWRNAITPPKRDPLAIDLDGDGIETVGIPNTGSPILFDHDADGVRTGTGWLKGDDAWLVFDRNGNGSIDSGRELFGVDTLITVTEPIIGTAETVTYTRAARNGFEALRSVDTGNGTAGSAGYGDGVFDSKDAAFTQVKLWQDLNQDGISQSTELFTLPSKGITSISLNASTTSTNLGNGNTVTGQATVTRSNGANIAIDSVDLQASNLELANNPFYRQFPSTIPLMSVGTASAQQLAQTMTGCA